MIKRPAANGRGVNLKKLRLMYTRIKYLGHVIYAEGLHPDLVKLKAVNELRRPCGFLEAIEYFRRFNKDFVNTAEPLTRRLRNQQKWSWYNDTAAAFG